MVEITVKVDGMMCSMCEVHVNDAIRKAIRVKRVSSSHKKGETVIVSEENVSEEMLAEIIGAIGYRVVGMECSPYEKRGFLSFFRK